MKKVIATSWHPGGANAIIPVIKQLREESRLEVVIIGHEFSKKRFKEEEIPYRKISSYALNEVNPSTMTSLLELEEPNLIITGTSTPDKEHPYPVELSMSIAAKGLKIPSLAVLDFWGSYRERFLPFEFDEETKTHLPTTIAVMDTLAIEEMLKRGFPRETLEVTGNPHFDDLVNLKRDFTSRDRERVRNDLNINPNSYLIMFASQPIEHHYGDSLGYTEKTALEELLGATELLKDKHKNLAVLVKVHPRENFEEVESVANKFKIPVTLDKVYNIKQAMLASDVIISPFSTSLIESTYLGIPSISLQPGKKEDQEEKLITNTLKVTAPVYVNGLIGTLLEGLISDSGYIDIIAPNRKDFMTDGHATERVKNLAYVMAQAI